MKRNVVIFLLIFCFSFTFVFAQTAAESKKTKTSTTKNVQETKKISEPAQQSAKKSKTSNKKEALKTPVKKTKPTVGVVISLLDFATGASGEVNKEKALELVNNGQPLAIKVGTKKKPVIYLVVNPDGTIANKKLAELADAKVGIIGKIKKRNGINVIISDIIEQYK